MMKKRNLKLDSNAEINIKNDTRDNQLPNIGDQGFIESKECLRIIRLVYVICTYRCRIAEVFSLVDTLQSICLKELDFG